METALVTLTIPKEFRIFCVRNNLTEAELLQRYLNHINLFGVLTYDQYPEEEKSLTAQISQLVGERFSAREPSSLKNRDLHVYNMQRLMVLICKDIDADEKQEQYHEIINHWYENIQ